MKLIDETNTNQKLRMSWLRWYIYLEYFEIAIVEYWNWNIPKKFLIFVVINFKNIIT